MTATQTTPTAANPYAIAAGAAGLLAGGGPDARAAAEHYARALAALRLTAPGFRLLDAPPPAGAPGPILWSSRARRFAANLKALEAQCPEAALVADAAKDLGDYELYQAADGNYQILDTARPVFAGWLGGLGDHKAALKFGWENGASRVVQPIAFDGVGMGWSLMQFLESTANSYLNYSCAVYVLVRDPLALAMALHLHDWRTLIAGPRIRWSIGTTAEGVIADFQRELRAHPTWTLPGQSVHCPLRGSTAIGIENAVVALRAEREAHLQALQADIAAHYADRNAGFWHRRFAQAASGGEPLRVLGITSRFTTVLQYSMQELQAAARAAGAAMEIAIEPDDQSLENPFVQRIAEMRPDLIVQISRMRYENPRLPANVPFLAWDQDNLPCMRTDGAKASLDALTYVAGHGAIFGYGHLDWPARNCLFCHPAGATHRYHNAPVSPDLLAQHACDVSYVSNASGTPEALHAQLRERWSATPAARAYDAACQRICAESMAGTVWEDIGLRRLLEAEARAAALPLTDALSHELLMDLHRYADRCFRHATLAWVSRWCATHGKVLRLYGRGWEGHPEFARWAAGIAEPGEPLRAIYQASRINLQLIESGFIHSRALDGLAAGGFFLTRHVTADGDDAATLREIHWLGKWTIANGITRPEQLTVATDTRVRAAWQATLAHHPWTPEHALKVLRVWAQTPQAAVAFPMLGDVSFHDEPSFGRLAGRYLADPALRQSTAAAMRQITLDQFSYDSRWNQFTRHIGEALADPPAAR